MARESRLWQWMSDGLKGTKGLHMRRVENRVGDGDPDVDGVYLGRYFEVELKGCDRPVRDGRLDFEVRRSQVLWHRKRTRCMGNNWIYVRVGRAHQVRRYLVEGKHAERLYDGITEAELLELSVLHPVHTPWDFLMKMAPLNT